MVAKAAAGLSVVRVAAGCDDSGGAATPDAATGDGSAGAGTCSTIPEETAGPYPGDGTNGANALALAGIVRADIRPSIAGATGIATGIPLTVTLTIVDSQTCSPLAGRAVYIWHCDRDGKYSMYSAAVAGENYLRGVQVSDAAGAVTFTTIFPGCYSGRWPHIHFGLCVGQRRDQRRERDRDLAARDAKGDLRCGLRDDRLRVERAEPVADHARVRQRVLDGATLEIPTTTGTVLAGFASALTVAIVG